jgi:hypothetical protein
VSSHWLEELTLRDGSASGGNVDVPAAEGRAIERAAGARVDGEVPSGVLPSPREHYLDHYRSWRFYAYHLPGSPRRSCSACRPPARPGDLPRLDRERLAAPALARRRLRRARGDADRDDRRRARRSWAFPIAIAALFLYILALYTADLAVGAWLGGLLVPPADDSLFEFGKSLAAGLAIMTVVSIVPFLGPPAGVVALLLGLGLLSERARAALG